MVPVEEKRGRIGRSFRRHKRRHHSVERLNCIEQ